MSDYSEIQKKIIGVVDSYKQFYPDDYLAVVKIVKDKRENLKNKFGDMTKKLDYMERPLTEYPETLFFLLNKILSEKEMEYFSSTKGHHWFATQYPEFRITAKV
jgi:hypothetical protein